MPNTIQGTLQGNHFMITPRNTWAIDLEVKRSGSNSFTWKTFLVRAEQSKVLQWALDDAHDEGYEVRGHRDERRIS